MTTPRHRRHPDEVTRDRLVAKLRKQEAKMHRLEVEMEGREKVWQKTKVEYDQTQIILTKLGMKPLPGFEQVSQPPDQESNLAESEKPQIVSESPDQSAGPLLPPTTCPWHPDGPPHPHRALDDGTQVCVEVEA